MIIDKKKVLKHFDDDKELIGELLVVFEESYLEYLNGLISSVAENNMGKIEFHAHTLKGMVAIFFAPSLVDITGKLENMGTNKVLSDTSELLIAIERDIPVMLKEIRELI